MLLKDVTRWKDGREIALEKAEAKVPRRRPGAVDVADALLCVLVFRRATALVLSPNDREYEAALVGEASPEPLLSLPLPIGHAVAARLGLVGGLDPWAPGGRLGRIDVRVRGERTELLVVLRDTPWGFAVELRRLVAPAAATGAVALESGAGRLGPYHLERETGRGSMGIVYLARRDGSGPPVAVKLLNPSIACDREISARFVREGRAAALVNDPGVVGVTDFGTLPDGQAFLVMEWVEGRTLEEALGEGGTLPPAEAVRVVLKIAAALEAAHVRGVVHRDLKPSNVFLTPDGQVKIADFGAALVEDPLRGAGTEAGLILGTPAYMAPEQALALPTDARADLYALGVVAFECLTGSCPYPGAHIDDVLWAVTHGERPSLGGLRPDLSGPIDDWMDRALHSDPFWRFSSAKELDESLDLALSSLHVARVALRRAA
jgi:serine/threonine-protein kinase